MLERLEQMEQKLVLALARLCCGLSRKAIGLKGTNVAYRCKLSR